MYLTSAAAGAAGMQQSCFRPTKAPALPVFWQGQQPGEAGRANGTPAGPRRTTTMANHHMSPCVASLYHHHHKHPVMRVTVPPSRFDQAQRELWMAAT